MASCCILSLFLGKSCSCRSLLVYQGLCRLPVILCCNLKAPSGQLRWKSCFCHATIHKKTSMRWHFLLNSRGGQSRSFNNYVTMPSSLLDSPLMNLAARLWMVSTLFTSFFRWGSHKLMHTLHVVLPWRYTLAPWSVEDILRVSFLGMPVSGLPFLLYVYVLVPFQVWLKLDSKIGVALYWF